MSAKREYNLLCTLFQMGEEDAYDCIWEKMENLVRAMLPKYLKMYPTNLYYDNCISESMLTIYKCAGKFDVTRGYSFTSYAMRAVRNRLLDMLKQWRRLPAYEGERVTDMSFDDFIESLADTSITFSSAADSHTLFAELGDAVEEKLDEEEESLFTALRMGIPDALIADMFDWTGARLKEAKMFLELRVRYLLENDEELIELKLEY